MKRLALASALMLAAVPAMAQYNPYSAMIQPLPSGGTFGYQSAPQFTNPGMVLVSPIPTAPAPQLASPYSYNPVGQGWQQFRPGFGR